MCESVDIRHLPFPFSTIPPNTTTLTCGRFADVLQVLLCQLEGLAGACYSAATHPSDVTIEELAPALWVVAEYAHAVHTLYERWEADRYNPDTQRSVCVSQEAAPCQPS